MELVSVKHCGLIKIGCIDDISFCIFSVVPLAAAKVAVCIYKYIKMHLRYVQLLSLSEGLLSCGDKRCEKAHISLI